MTQHPGGTFRLFVYGTLKRGGTRHPPLASQRFLGECHTTPHYGLYLFGTYPGLKRCPEGGQVVHGELFEVDASLRQWLDLVEGAPDWFQLDTVEIVGQPGPVWAYYYQMDPGGNPRIASGRWDPTPPAC